MRITAVAAVVLASAGAAHASERVSVYVNSNLTPLDVIELAEKISSRMFISAGVNVEWHSSKPRLRRQLDANRIIVIDFEPHTAPGRKPGSLAYAFPFERVHIVVFWDRILESSRNNPELRPMILAHVLAHEITHNLQGRDHHSTVGIMKPRWDAADYLSMTRSPLTFTSEDIELLQVGMLRREMRAQRE